MHIQDNLEHQQNVQLKNLSNANTSQLLENLCTNETVNTKVVCIHQLFEKQVESSPDAIAVVFENQQLTYRQLNQQANQLAHHLRTLGVEPEVLVGICVERSLEMVIGILGILKAGGAYVPLDPTYPLERLSFILEDIQASITLTTQKWLKSLPLKGQVVCLDSDWPLIAQNSKENPINHTNTDNLIYVIYTSGSTGQPKGVMIPHSGIYNQLYWRQTTFKLTATDKVLQTISFSFDPSVWQIFWPLCFGAQLVMAHPQGHRDSDYLVRVICEQQITVMALVPSLLQVLLEQKGIENCQSLRHITCGGEALPVELVERFFERLQLNNVLFNCYGPTEAAIDASFWKCQRGINYAIAPIGRPITNTEIYILNENLQPVASGETGEIYIGGMGLARGYLNRPELTAQKFIPHPCKSESIARLYKTGDLGRFLPDGNIEFLGRIDQQLKIRGFRIEIGEIEAVLNQHPALKQALVIAREDIPGNKRLVAYLVANAEPVPSEIQLHRFLQDKLPDYMIPAAFVFLDALPLNPNGKVDRRRLPAPESVRHEVKEGFVAPRNHLEVQLTKIWQQVLGIRSVGVKDNFFELGGNSLLAMRLLVIINRRFDQSLPLSTFLAAQTVEQLASVLADQEKQVSWPSLVPIQTNGDKPPLFCVHALEGNVLLYQNLAQHLKPDQPVYGLQAQGLDGQQAPSTSIVEMASRYIQEIRQVQLHGPYFLAGFSLGGLIAYEMAQQLDAQGEKIALLAIFDLNVSITGYHPPEYWQSKFSDVVKVLSLKPKERLGYVWERIQWTVTRGRGRNLYRLYLRHIKRSPFEEQLLNVVVANNQAAKSYLPLVYPGKLTLFRASEQDANVDINNELVWKHLAAGGLEKYKIPGSHESIMYEPNVRFLAHKLTICLQQALAENKLYY